jgi:homoserine O-acetyltransferase
MKRLTALVLSVWMLSSTALGAASYPAPSEGDFVIKDFHFASGETLPELRLHYRTVGRLKRDDAGHALNAVLILHGTSGAGDQFLNDRFAGVLFGPGQLLDAERYFIVLPDGIGHGKSSKPSNGLHMRFPHYTYDDMVLAHHELLVQKLGVDHLRLVMGTSMGGMHTWVWGEAYPEFMDALLPLACLPAEIAGRNRMMRRMIMDSIRSDPDWKAGEYSSPPIRGLTSAAYIFIIMSSCPLEWQKQAPTRDAADKMLDTLDHRLVARFDANDLLYQIDASRDYNPAPRLATIRAPLLAINSADDQINPPELRILEMRIKEVAHGRMVLLPITDQTRGHGTHTIAAIWKDRLADLLASTGPPRQ